MEVVSSYLIVSSYIWMGLRSLRSFFAVRLRHAALFCLAATLLEREREHTVGKGDRRGNQAQRSEPKMTEARTEESAPSSPVLIVGGKPPAST
eukprot:5059657-Amphidinium_carterae.2